MGSDTRILVTGASGQVGTALKPLLPGARFLGLAELDVRDPRSVDAEVADAEVIVHLAAMTGVDECEREPESAFSANANGTRNVCKAAEAASARVVYLSTDYVFDGTKAGEYLEEDEPAPLNVYGRSKLEGEMHVRTRDVNLTIRTSWVFGDGNNFVSTILRAAGERGRVRVVDDQRGRPTPAEAVADAIVYLMREETTGTVHVCGAGTPCTWAGLADEVVRIAGVDAVVDPVSTAEYVETATTPIAPRPANSVLSLEKAQRLGVPLRDWRDSLDRYVRGPV